MALLNSSDFENLPEDPGARWVKLRDLLEARLNLLRDDEGSTDSHLLEYCAVLPEAARDLGVGDVGEVPSGNIRDEFEWFRVGVVRLATTLSLKLPATNRGGSVALQRATRAKILNQIQRLRKSIAESELSASQRSRAEQKLDELEVLVLSPRTDLSRLWLALACVGAFTCSTTSFLADAPDAIGTITSLIGSDKLEEDEEQRAIDETKTPLALQDLRDGPTNDDPIPF